MELHPIVVVGLIAFLIILLALPSVIYFVFRLVFRLVFRAPSTRHAMASHVCPACGARLPPDSPHGLCPTCLLQQGFDSPPQVAPSPSQAPTLVPTSSPREEAPSFPHLEILEPLGRGGMGAVYKARQTKLNRLVAVKVLPEEWGKDPAFAERFTREAKALARLNHPHIVAVHDFGHSEGL